MIFKITAHDVEYSNLETSDIGKWGYIVNGCFQIFDTEQDARESFTIVNA